MYINTKVQFLLFSILIFLMPLQHDAQVPEKVSYQMLIRDSGNEIVSGQAIGVKVCLLQGSSSGTAVYEETHVQTTNASGLLSLEIGTGTSSGSSFSSIDWSSGTYYIETQVDLSGGTTYSISATSQLLSVPYALHAKTVENLNTYQIGDAALGGTVFWVDETEQHGLVCANTDQDNDGIQWDDGTDGYTSTFAMGDGVYAGKMNTQIIVAVLTGSANVNNNSYAAHLCHQLNTATDIDDGYGDWYLPSLYELTLLYNAHLTTNSSDSFTPLEQKVYWSSTENPDNKAQAARVHFLGGGISFTASKSNSYKVRAIRAF